MSLKCGHPNACWCDDEDDLRCLWCEDVERLTGQAKALRQQLNKRAVILTGGQTTINGDVGLLEITGGEVHLFANKVGASIGEPVLKTLVIVPDEPDSA